MKRQRHVIKVDPYVHPRSDSTDLAEAVPIATIIGLNFMFFFFA